MFKSMKEFFRSLTLIEYMIIVAILGLLIGIVTGGGSTYSGHPDREEVVQDVRQNQSGMVEVCHEGQVYIVRNGRLVSVDERC